MKLSIWNIWHTYSTYFNAIFYDLDEVARILVESELALCAIHTDGKTYWKSGGKVLSGITTYDLDSSGNSANYRLARDNNDFPGPEDYALDSWLQSVNFRFNELRQFGEDSSFPSPYVRAFLGKFNLISDTTSEIYSCYPLLKIFDTGVIIVEYRLISGDEEIDLDTFINRYVNMFKTSFSRIEVNPAFAILAPKAYSFYTNTNINFFSRLKLESLSKKHSQAIKSALYKSNEGDFEFEMAPLTSHNEDYPGETLKSLSMTVFSIVSYVLSKPRTGIGLILRGQRNLITMGSYWSGRPHIHLIRFVDQKEKSIDNENTHGNSFLWILLRTFLPKYEKPPYELPKDLRPFDDYSCYINIGVTLWVWSNSGIREYEHRANPNWNHLIYGNQATVEMLEYGYLLHRSLYDRSHTMLNPDEVLSLRRSIIQLQFHISESSRFGEIRDLLKKGWEYWNLPELQMAIQHSIDVSATETQLKEYRWKTKVMQRLAVFFGFVSAIPIAKAFLEPLWRNLGFWLTGNSFLDSFLLSIVAFVPLWLSIRLIVRQPK